MGIANDSEIDEVLAAQEKEFAEAPVEERENFAPVPDGKYQVKVEAVELTQARTTRVPMLKWTLKILGPTQRNRLMWRYNLFATKENIKWLKNDLHICGLDLAKLTELRDRLGALLDVKLEVTKQTRDGYDNVFFNSRIVTTDDGSLGGRGASNSGRAASYDDIPF